MDLFSWIGALVALPSLSSVFTVLVNWRNSDKIRENRKELQQQRQATQLKLAGMNIQAQATLETRRQEHQARLQMGQQQFQAYLQRHRQRFQERMSQLQFGQQLTLEQARQEFQVKLNQLNHEQQREIQKFVLSVNWAIAQGNLDFQKWRFEQEQTLQRQLADYNRETQLRVAAYQRETSLKSVEAHKLFENWPLRLVPSQILNSHRGASPIPLRVLISPPDVDYDKFGQNTKDFPKMEKRVAQGLNLLFSQHYPLSNSIRPVELLDGAWDSKRFHGGASIKALFSALQSEPTLILESEIDGDYFNLRVAYWGIGHATYERKPIISQLPFREILYESAKQQARSWKETRQKLSAMGLSLEKADKDFGGKKAENLKRLLLEEKLRQANISSKEYPFHYEVTREDWEVLYEQLTWAHSLIAAFIADAHHLVHGEVPPLLPQLLPQLLKDKQTELLPELVQVLVEGYHGVFSALEIERPAWIPDLILQLAQGLTSLPDKSWAKKEVAHSVRSWLQRRLLSSKVKEGSLDAMLEAMKPVLTQTDKDYLEPLQTCLDAIGDKEAVTKVKELLTNLQALPPVPSFQAQDMRRINQVLNTQVPSFQAQDMRRINQVLNTQVPAFQAEDVRVIDQVLRF